MPASEDDYVFRIFACGGKGGAYSSDLTSFFIAHKHQPYNFIAMDAGTALDCIRKAKQNGVFDDYLSDKTNPDFKDKGKNKGPAVNDVGWFKQHQLNGFLVTHAHIDHTAGLVVGSADDKFGAMKPVISQAPVLEGLKTTFKQPLWPPMFDLGFYEAKTLSPGDGFKNMKDLGSNLKSGRFAGSQIKVRSFLVSHDSSRGGSPSTAFLICDTGDKACVLFFGDVGPDKWEWKNWKENVVRQMVAEGTIKALAVPDYMDKRLAAKNEDELKEAWHEGPDELKRYAQLFKQKTGSSTALLKDYHPLRDVWDAVMPLIKNGKLRTIFIETSYQNSRPGGMLYGHLTPALLQDELDYIESKLQEEPEPIHIKVFAMHIKPTFAPEHSLNSPYREIRKELNAVESHFGLAQKLRPRITIPYQTDMIYVDSIMGTEIDRHGSYVSAKADVHPMQLHRDADEDHMHGQQAVGYQEEHQYEQQAQSFGREYAPYQVRGYAPGYVVDAPPTSVVGSQAADLLPIFLFVCGWVFHRVSRPRKVPRFARLAAQDQDDIEYGDRI